MAKQKVPAKKENLEKMIAFILEGIKGTGFTPREIKQIHLVGEEVLLNIINYAYPGKVGDIEISYRVDDSKKELVLEFVDQGVPFDPLSVPEPDVNLPVEERQIGGLGIFLVRKIMDEARYKREGGKNILTLSKHFG